MLIFDKKAYSFRLKKNKLTQGQLFAKKIHLYRKLMKTGLSQDKIHNLLSFIKYYSPFEKSEINIKFDNEINVISQNVINMGIQERLLAYSKQEGKIEGKEEGQEEGIDITLQIIDLLKEGKSIVFISNKVGKSKERILEIKMHLNL